MLKEETTVNKIEVLADGQIQVRQATRILKDGTEIAKTYHRHVLKPGDDLTGQDKKVIAIAKAAWKEK